MLARAAYESLRSAMASSPGPARGAVAGVLVGAVLVAVLAATDWPARPHAAASSGSTALVDRPADDRALLTAWRRSRQTTWFVRMRLERRTARGALLDTELRIAQRPPDRLTTGLGSVDGTVHGRRVSCSAGVSGVLRCRDIGAAPRYDSEVQRDVDLLRGYITGARRLYAARRDGGSCFRLTLVAVLPSPPYGRDARFCFDRATGAPTAVEVHRDEGSDVERALEVRAQVTDADLTPP